jgi:hypothetical protein
MSKSRDIADSAETINFIDGLTSDAQSQLDGKATLDASPTFTGTVTATAFSGDGSALTGVDSLPSQTGNNGLFLTTDGSTASWAEAGGGAWELLATYTPSGASTVDIEDFDTTYDDYCLVIDNLYSNAGYVSFRLKIGGSYKTDSYTWMYNWSEGNPQRNSSSTYIRPVYLAVAESESSGPANIICWMLNVNNTSKRNQIFGTSTTRSAYWMQTGSFGGSYFGAAGAIQGIQIFPQEGGVISGGTIKIYGIKKA